MSCIIVLGPHRSGTSLVAGIMRMLGVSMGDRFREPDGLNSFGYHEDIDFKDLNHDILKFSGHTWWNPPVDSSIFEFTDATTRIKMLVDRKVSMHKHKTWGWKDPRQILLMDLYAPIIPKDTKYIVVSRDVRDVTASLANREEKKDRRTLDRGFDYMYWSRLTQDYYSRIMKYVSGKNYMIVSYERLTNVGYAETIVRDMVVYCGLTPYLRETDVLDYVVAQALGVIRYANKL